MFLIVVVLAIIGLASVLGFTASTAIATLGALVIVPILLFKLLALFAIFGVVGRTWNKRPGGHRHTWRRWEGGRSEPEGPSDEDRFEEWHRIAHAKDEVDSWAPEV